MHDVSERTRDLRMWELGIVVTADDALLQLLIVKKSYRLENEILKILTRGERQKRILARER